MEEEIIELKIVRKVNEKKERLHDECIVTENGKTVLWESGAEAVIHSLQAVLNRLQ